MISQSYIHIT